MKLRLTNKITKEVKEYDFKTINNAVPCQLATGWIFKIGFTNEEWEHIPNLQDWIIEYVGA